MNLWHLFQKLRPFVRPYRMLVIATLILTLIGSFTAQVNALTLHYAVDSINALIEAGQGLAAGWHILITISAILLGKEIINAFVAGALTRWKTELISRIIPENLNIVRAAKKVHDVGSNDHDCYMWAKVNELRQYLAKDTIDVKSLFSLVEEALNDGDYETASALQIEMYDKIEELKVMYAEYKKNII